MIYLHDPVGSIPVAAQRDPVPPALRRQPNLRAFYEHLRARGKAKMVALVAVMRKLLHAIFGMFKHQTAFDGDMLYPLPAAEISTTEAAA